MTPPRLVRPTHSVSMGFADSVYVMQVQKASTYMRRDLPGSRCGRPVGILTISYSMPSARGQESAPRETLDSFSLFLSFIYTVYECMLLNDPLHLTWEMWRQETHNLLRSHRDWNFRERQLRRAAAWTHSKGQKARSM
jgi:hypothetical protein